MKYSCPGITMLTAAKRTKVPRVGRCVNTIALTEYPHGCLHVQFTQDSYIDIKVSVYALTIERDVVRKMLTDPSLIGPQYKIVALAAYHGQDYEGALDIASNCMSECFPDVPKPTITIASVTETILGAYALGSIVTVRMGIKYLLKMPTDGAAAVLILNKLRGMPDICKQHEILKPLRPLVKALFKRCAATASAEYLNLRKVLSRASGSGTKLLDEFLALPWPAFHAWIKRDDICADSENTVAYMAFRWALKDPARGKHGESILGHIRFTHLRVHYINDIMHPAIAKAFPDEKCVALGKKLAYAALTYKLCPEHPSVKHLRDVPARLPVPENGKTIVACVYQDINKWEPSGSYYSSPVIVHGYEIYYFVKRHQHATTGHVGLAGFLRCSTTFATVDYYLPMRYEVVLKLNDGTSRHYTPMTVIYRHPTKAIGGLVSSGTETWDDVIALRTPLTRKNCITALITLEFLDSSDGCLDEFG